MDVGVAKPGSEKDRRHLWFRKALPQISQFSFGQPGPEGRKGSRSRCEWKRAVRE